VLPSNTIKLNTRLQDGRCHYDETKQRVQIESYVNVTGGEEGLKLALFNQGAVAVNIDASHKSLSFYQSGVYYEPLCSKHIVIHVTWQHYYIRLCGAARFYPYS